MSLIFGTLGLALLVAITLLGASSEALAHEPQAEAVALAAARTFGTSSLVSHTLHASAFTGATAADNAAIREAAADEDRYCLGTDQCVLRAPVILPAGAMVRALELEACDTSGTGVIQAIFLRRPSGGGSFGYQASTGAPTATPGCQRFEGRQSMRPSTISTTSTTSRYASSAQ